jgi:protein gp37
MSFNKTLIDWPGLTHSFNPVVGCKRDCKFSGAGCYASKLHNKRHKAYLAGKLQNCEQYALPFETMQFFRERLDKAPPKSARRIFVGDMTDIDYWHTDWIRQVVDYCGNYPRVEFMFLSKGALAYCYDGEWPQNTMQGLTLTCTQSPTVQAESIMEISQNVHPYLSLEPLLGTFYEADLSKIELVICGAETGKGAKPPNPHWIDSVRNNVPKEKLHWKNNIKRFL